MSSAEENRKTLDAIYDAFFKGDINKWMSFLAEDAVMWEADSLPYGGVAKGVTAIRATLDKIAETWESDVAFDVDHVFTSDNGVVACGTFRATSRATGRKVSVPLAEMWIIRNGKVTEVKAIYGDTKLIADALALAA